MSVQLYLAKVIGQNRETNQTAIHFCTHFGERITIACGGATGLLLFDLCAMISSS